MASDSFPPAQLKGIVNEVATLLKEKKETVAVAETVRHSAISVTYSPFVHPMNTIRCKQQESTDPINQPSFRLICERLLPSSVVFIHHNALMEG